MSNLGSDGNGFRRVGDRHVVQQPEQQGSWGYLSGRARANIVTGARSMAGAPPEYWQGDPRTVEGQARTRQVEGSRVDFNTDHQQGRAQRYPLEKGTPEYAHAMQQYNSLYGNYIRMDVIDYDHNEVLRMIQKSTRSIYDESTSNIYPNRQSNNPDDVRLAKNKEIEEFINRNFNRDLPSSTTFVERDEQRIQPYRSERSRSRSDEDIRRQERRQQLQEVLADDSTTEIGEIERNRPSYDPALGWQGSSRAGFEGLVRQVAELDPLYYNSRLSDTIYSLYRAGKVSRRPFSGVSIPLWNISCPRGVVKKLGNNDKFIYFLNKDVYNREIYGTGEKNIMRMVLNVKPDMINETTQDIVNHIVTLDYVALAKVESDPQGAEDNFDNMIICFSKNRLEDLKSRLRGYREATRSGHTAMLQPIDSGIQGIAFGDDRYVADNTMSWGRRHTQPIVEAVRELQRRNILITPETLLPTAENHFRASQHPIDPDNPHLYIERTFRNW